MALMPPEEWKPYPKTLKWLEGVYAEPKFVKSVGVVAPCAKAMAYDAAGPQPQPRPALPLPDVGSLDIGSPEPHNGWPSQRIRQTFLEYFAKNEHTIVPSSPWSPTTRRCSSPTGITSSRLSSSARRTPRAR